MVSVSYIPPFPIYDQSFKSSYEWLRSCRKTESLLALRPAPVLPVLNLCLPRLSSLYLRRSQRFAQISSMRSQLMTSSASAIFHLGSTCNHLSSARGILDSFLQISTPSKQNPQNANRTCHTRAKLSTQPMPLNPTATTAMPSAPVTCCISPAGWAMIPPPGNLSPETLKRKVNRQFSKSRPDLSRHALALMRWSAAEFTSST